QLGDPESVLEVSRVAIDQGSIGRQRLAQPLLSTQLFCPLTHGCRGGRGYLSRRHPGPIENQQRHYGEAGPAVGPRQHSIPLAGGATGSERWLDRESREAGAKGMPF